MTHSSASVVRGCLLALALLVALGGMHSAVAADGPQTVTFQCLGLPQYFNVPPGVTQITVHAEGAGAGSQGSGGPGKGGVVNATLAVVPGHMLQIDVGCRG